MLKISEPERVSGVSNLIYACAFETNGYGVDKRVSGREQNLSALIVPLDPLIWTFDVSTLISSSSRGGRFQGVVAQLFESCCCEGRLSKPFFREKSKEGTYYLVYRNSGT